MKFDQYFLTNPNILEKEASLIPIFNKRILEIGVGLGTLSKILLSKNPKQFFAIEIDRNLAYKLKKTAPKIQVINKDFLKVDASSFPEIDIIFSNVPYSISSKFLFHLLDFNFKYAVLCFQKEFAQKMFAKPNASNYGRLSVMSQIYFKVSPKFTIKAGSFTPKPRVDSQVLLLEKKRDKLSKQQIEIINKLFQHKNKTIRAILKHTFSISNQNIFNLFLDKRPRQLSVEQVQELANLILSSSEKP